MKAKPVSAEIDGKLQIIGYRIECLGCKEPHVIYTNLAYHKSNWSFNGDLEKPTFSPSLLCTTGSFAEPSYVDDPLIPPTRCHSFIKDGKMQFLSDCTHALAGQTVDLPDIPE